MSVFSVSGRLCFTCTAVAKFLYWRLIVDKIRRDSVSNYDGVKDGINDGMNGCRGGNEKEDNCGT